jgi:hypothetical protein
MSGQAGSHKYTTFCELINLNFILEQAQAPLVQISSYSVCYPGDCLSILPVGHCSPPPHGPVMLQRKHKERAHGSAIASSISSCHWSILCISCAHPPRCSSIDAGPVNDLLNLCCCNRTCPVKEASAISEIVKHQYQYELGSLTDHIVCKSMQTTLQVTGCQRGCANHDEANLANLWKCSTPPETNKIWAS